jgi:hypothetical protein
MGYLLAVIVMILLAVLFGFSGGCKKTNTQKSEKSKIELAEEKESPARAKIRQRLSELAHTSQTYLSPYRNVSAYCYVSVRPPEKLEYICPKCNEKTFYQLGDSSPIIELLTKENNERYIASNDLYILIESIISCRRIVKEIHTVSIELNEIQFCKKCSSKVETPKLSMILRYEGKEEPYRVDDVTLDDIMLLKEFFNESKKENEKPDNSNSKIPEKEISDVWHFSWISEREIPMKSRIERLSELLGVEIEK